MKMIKTYRTLCDCDQARLVLEGSGIACSIRNEFSANTAGGGPVAPLPFAQPELWILDESQEPAARELLDKGPG
jgi:hypothetical protein